MSTNSSLWEGILGSTHEEVGKQGSNERKTLKSELIMQLLPEYLRNEYGDILEAGRY